MSAQEKKPNLGMLAAVNEGIDKANKRTAGGFDGLLGTLPTGTSELLQHIFAYLRHYLLEERRFSVEQVQRLCRAALPPVKPPRRKRFPAVPPELEDDGVRVSVGLLNSIASVLRLQNQQTIRLLLSGQDGVRGAKVREGGGKRGKDTQQEQDRRNSEMQSLVDRAAQQNPKWSYRECARHVAKQLSCSDRTVRRNTKNPRSATK